MHIPSRFSQQLKIALLSSLFILLSTAAESKAIESAVLESTAVENTTPEDIAQAEILPVLPIPAQPNGSPNTSESSLNDPLPTQVTPAQASPFQTIPSQAPIQPVPASPVARPPVFDPPPETAYTLGSGDIVNIDIFRVPQYSGESQVLVDGTLNLPLIGKVSVKGLSLEEASKVLSNRYGSYLKRPIITISLLTSRPIQVGIAGEVGRPGAYSISQDGARNTRLSQIIETAGGITQTADLYTIQVKRTQLNGTQETITANLWDLIENGNINQDIVLRDGDSIFIPTAIARNQNAALLADASFATDVNKPVNVAIIGEVYRPGPYTLQGGTARTGNAGTPGSSNSVNAPTTVTRAIQVAGGIKPEADIRKVQVIRSTRTGTPQIFDVNLWELLQAGDLQQDAILQEGDTVFVPVATALTPAEVGQIAEASFSPDTIRVNVVGEVEQAGVAALPPNTPLSQAILAAGGFNNRARRGSAELVRINEDGTVNRTRINVDFAEGIDEANNPLLRNNDVVIVNRSGLAAVSDTIRTVAAPLGGFFSIFRFFDIFR